jgi:hypothetical protein
MKNIAIEKLIPYEFNNRNHNEEQVNRIANSIKEFGFNQPIVIDENNIILVGHGRHLAALKLGLKEVPVLIKSGLSETQKKAYRILDNKLQNDSTWSFDNLELELGFLEDNAFQLEPWGLDELNRFFGAPNDAEKEWDGMPEFNQDDQESLQTIKVHFKSRQDVDQFSELVKQQLTEKTQSIWFPEVAPLNLKKLALVDDES